MTHFYVDPTDPAFVRPNLIDRLMRFPSRQALTPHENQLTEALAWLLSNSSSLARAVAAVFFEGDVEALAALDNATTFGTRTQLTMPLPGGGQVFPDLSLAGDARTFELLVEVKVDASPHAFESGSEWILQPDMYVRAWDARPPATQARVRRVGTLTRGGFSFPSNASSTRGRDVEWREAADATEAVLAAGEIEPHADKVAEDFVAVVKARVLGDNALPSREHIDTLLEDGGHLALLTGKRLRDELSVRGASKCVRRTDYQGTYFWLTTSDRLEVQFWLSVLPAGGRYNVHGLPDCLSMRIMEGAADLGDERLLAGGFRFLQDIAGYRRYQVHWPIASTGGRIKDVAASAQTITTEFSRCLRSCDPPLV